MACVASLPAVPIDHGALHLPHRHLVGLAYPRSLQHYYFVVLNYFVFFSAKRHSMINASRPPAVPCSIIMIINTMSVTVITSIVTIRIVIINVMIIVIMMCCYEQLLLSLLLSVVVVVVAAAAVVVVVVVVRVVVVVVVVEVQAFPPAGAPPCLPPSSCGRARPVRMNG